MFRYFYFLTVLVISFSCRLESFDAKSIVKLKKTATFKYSLEELADNVELLSRGKWWEDRATKYGKLKDYEEEFSFEKLARDKVIAFALYTVHSRTVKLSVQLYPLFTDEDKEVFLDLHLDGQWQEMGKEDVPELGWSALFRIENWGFDEDVRYRVRHSKGSSLEGIIRCNPKGKNEIVVASLSCIHHKGKKKNQAVKDIVDNLKIQKPDLLFFAGDQTYMHNEHTAGWLLFGSYFRNILKDYPSVIIPDDHDVGQSNLWGRAGRNRADASSGKGGGYHKSASYVNMVQRAQTAHLPDPYDPYPLANGIGVYYTSLNWGGIDFAILEDRKWKSSPSDLGTDDELREKGFWNEGQQKERPDHITNTNFDVTIIDDEKFVMIGERQYEFLTDWSQNWRDAEMKVLLSQTPFAALAHIHKGERLVADLDSNGWPQNKRKKVLKVLRSALAIHLAGDQHLMTLSQHGIDDWSDGIWSFVSPAMGYGIYPRGWAPEKKDTKELFKSKFLKYTGKFFDSFKNKVTMHSYANQQGEESISRGLGYSLVRFNKQSRQITFESYPRFISVNGDNAKQFYGLPKTINQWDNDGRKVVGYLPEVVVSGIEKPVLQVVNEKTSEVLYTLRLISNRFRPPVYDVEAKYTVKVGKFFADLAKEKKIGVDVEENKKIYLDINN